MWVGKVDFQPKWMEKLHKNLPLGIVAVSASVLVSVPGLVPAVVAKGIVWSIFGTIGVPAILHIDHPLDTHALMTAAAFSALLIGQGPEGAFLLSLFHLAHAVQHKVQKRATRDVDRLVKILPESVRVISPGGSMTDMHPHTVPVGSTILVLPNSVCPIDGILLGLAPASIQVSHITGEPAIVETFPSSSIPAGAINKCTHAIELETTRLATESTLQRIVSLTQAAARSRPSVASAIDRFTPWYTAAVLVGSSAVALATSSVYMGLSVLVAASPCALLAAAPVAQAAALSACSRRGIILSSGAVALERFATADSLVVDKTGTITEGFLRPANVRRVTGDPEVALVVGGVLGRFGSSHPVSQGIGSTLSPESVARFRLDPVSVVETPGASVSGTVTDTKSDIQYNVVISKASPASHHLTESQISATSVQGDHVVIVALQDTVRPGVLNSLHRSSLPVYMLTGDNERAALAVAAQIGLSPEKVFAGMNPEMKAQFVLGLNRPIMVGDGVNDAPALAAAKAGGVAVASSVSGESIKSAVVSVADAVVVSDPIGAVNFLFLKSLKTDHIVKQNLCIALGGMLGTATAVLSGSCPLWLAVILHEGSTVLVVFNSLRNLNVS